MFYGSCTHTSCCCLCLFRRAKCVTQGLVQSTQDAERNAPRKFKHFPFDVACVQCGHPHSHQQVPFACVPRPVWIGPYHHTQNTFLRGLVVHACFKRPGALSQHFVTMQCQSVTPPPPRPNMIPRHPNFFLLLLFGISGC